ncbi:phage tail protein [Mucilaginibacter sp.]
MTNSPILTDSPAAQSHQPKFMYKVTLGRSEMYFQEAAGLGNETRVIEYRAGKSKVFTPVKIPGLAKTGNITLKKGFLKNNAALWNWFNRIKMNTVKRVTVVIQLVDETGTAVITWRLNNAFPTKVSSTNLKGNNKDVAIETLELACETLVITH